MDRLRRTVIRARATIVGTYSRFLAPPLPQLINCTGLLLLSWLKWRVVYARPVKKCSLAGLAEELD